MQGFHDTIKQRFPVAPLPPKSLLCLSHVRAMAKRGGAETSLKLDRKTIEKNRRVHMKSLCSKLVSLIPPSHFKISKVLSFSPFFFSFGLTCNFHFFPLFFPNNFHIYTRPAQNFLSFFFPWEVCRIKGLRKNPMLIKSETSGYMVSIQTFLHSVSNRIFFQCSAKNSCSVSSRDVYYIIMYRLWSSILLIYLTTKVTIFVDIPNITWLVHRIFYWRGLLICNNLD